MPLPHKAILSACNTLGDMQNIKMGEPMGVLGLLLQSPSVSSPQAMENWSGWISMPLKTLCLGAVFCCSQNNGKLESAFWGDNGCGSRGWQWLVWVCMALYLLGPCSPTASPYTHSLIYGREIQCDVTEPDEKTTSPPSNTLSATKSAHLRLKFTFIYSF